MFRMSRMWVALLFLAAPAASGAQTLSIAAEADAIAYGLSGYSGTFETNLRQARITPHVPTTT